jgi:hypothetical protein
MCLEIASKIGFLGLEILTIFKTGSEKLRKSLILKNLQKKCHR